ncbi:MAG TPA: Trp family transcriptional regulator [bacterium]|nr:Trp family transcriptional regulator [bacterium]
MPKRGIDREAKALLIETMARLDGQDKIIEFLNDLFSAEVKDLSRRLLAAKMLKEGKTYEEIGLLMGMSAGTVNKIHFKTKGSPLINSFFGR